MSDSWRKAGPRAVVPYDRSVVCPEVIDWLSRGRPLSVWCRKDPTRPSADTILGWANEDPDGFGRKYREAREAGAEIIAGDLLRIVDGRDDTDPSDVERRRLRADTRKWLLARWAPKGYGDRKQVEHAIGMKIQVTTGVPSPEPVKDVAWREVDQIPPPAVDSEP